LDAVHAQPSAVMMLKDPGPPPAPMLCVRGLAAKLHPLTVKVTGTVSGPVPVAVIVMVPVYVPLANPLGSARTSNVAGVVEPAGVTDSQFPVDEAEAESVAWAPVLVMPSVRVATAPPTWEEWSSAEGWAIKLVNWFCT
jgi:hypothetical protein